VPVSDVEQEVLGTANELIQSAEVEAVTTIIQGATVASFAAYLEALRIQPPLVSSTCSTCSSNEAVVAALLQAATEGSIEQCQAAAALGAPLSGPSLHKAAQNGHVDVVRYLLDKGAPVNGGAAAKGGFSTPLHVAAANGHVAVASALLEARANVTLRDPAGATPIHRAAQSSPEVLRIFLSGSAAVAEAALLVTKQGESPLHYAARAGNENTLALLLKVPAVNATVELLDGEGRSTLHWCILSAHEGALRMVATARADVNAQIKAVLHGRKGSRRKKAVRQEYQLHTAARVLKCARPRRRVAILRTLLEQRARVDTVDEEGCTPLHLAADVVYEPDEQNWEEYLDLGAEGVRLLLGAKAEVNAVDSSGRTPLFIAAQAGQLMTVQALIGMGADPDFAIQPDEAEGETARTVAEAVSSGAHKASWCMHVECSSRILAMM